LRYHRCALMTDTAIYVYCVVEAASPGNRARSLTGLPGAVRPTCLDLGRGLWAVVSEVPLSKYGPAEVEAGLRNLEWVAEIAVAHEAVVEHFATRRGATVVPMKLFTMFTSSDRAVSDLRAKRPTLTAALRRVRGCEEWGVRLVRAPRRSVGGSRLPRNASVPAQRFSRRRKRPGTGHARPSGKSATSWRRPMISSRRSLETAVVAPTSRSPRPLRRCSMRRFSCRLRGRPASAPQRSVRLPRAARRAWS
jgi:hypothetical protein